VSGSSIMAEALESSMSGSVEFQVFSFTNLHDRHITIFSKIRPLSLQSTSENSVLKQRAEENNNRDVKP